MNFEDFNQQPISSLPAGDYEEEPMTKPQENSRFADLVKQFKIRQSDLPFIAICLGASTYFTFHDPLFMVILGCCSILFLSLIHIARAIPIVQRYIGMKIRFWHVATLVLTSLLFFSVIDLPAHAVFLSSLESFFNTLAQGAQASGSGETISADVIKLIFNLIRGAFLLLVAAASLFAYNQAQQGNDWRPIVTQVGLAFAIVIAIDIVTFLFVGNGTT